MLNDRQFSEPRRPDHEVRCCDNLELLSSLESESLDLIYIDPPFNTGRARAKASSSHGFRDNWSGDVAGYLEFLAPRLLHMHRVLKQSGTIYVHLDWHAAHYVKVFLDELFGYENFLNEIIWHYRTGGLSKRWFARKHDNILSYAKCKGRHTFNLLRGGAFRTEGMNFDEEGRPFKSTKSGRLYFNPEGPAVTDVWDMPFLSTVALERSGYPSQKPLKLLERIISASSNAGDVVADFFCGSGTTLVAAKRLGRGSSGCDISAQAVEIAKQRLEETGESAERRQRQSGGS
jgi:DNA modification methylase